MTKPKTNAVKQEVEKIDELVRSALTAIAVLSKLPDESMCGEDAPLRPVPAALTWHFGGRVPAAERAGGANPRFAALVTALTNSPDLGPKFKDAQLRAELSDTSADAIEPGL